MVKLNFNAHGYFFQDDVNTIQHSYNAGVHGLTASLNRAEAEALTYNATAPSDPAHDPGADDYEDVDQGEYLHYRVESAKAAIQTLRKAFALVLYHSWERGARIWTQSPNGNHAKLAAKVKNLGVTLHPVIDDLYILTNALKHDSDKWGVELLSRQNGAFFPNGFQYSPGQDWYGSIEISDAMMSTLISATSASGPVTTTIFK